MCNEKSKQYINLDQLRLPTSDSFYNEQTSNATKTFAVMIVLFDYFTTEEKERDLVELQGPFIWWL
jgi:hypothetical protein